jgi:GGDEF domain-containing protein
MCGFLIMINELLRTRIVTLVSYDELTGLLNRRGFLHRAQQLCQSARAIRTPVSVLMMDLDHFSATNGVSIGVAPLGRGDLRAAMRAADIALYRAKGLGRNQVCDAPEPSLVPTAALGPA